jgi:hypothetical protein
VTSAALKLVLLPIVAVSLGCLPSLDSLDSTAMPSSVDVMAADDSVDMSATAFGFAVVTFVIFVVFAFFAGPLEEMTFLAVLHFALSLHLRLFCSAAVLRESRSCAIKSK